MRQLPSSVFASALVALQFLLGTPIGVHGQACPPGPVPFPVAQPCFDKATASAKCDNSSTAKFNPCACSNTGNWIGLSAACIGTADRSQLNDIYTCLQSNCGTVNPIAFSLNQWLAAAGSSAAAPSSTPVTSTTSQTSSVITMAKQTTPGTTAISTSV